MHMTPKQNFWPVIHCSSLYAARVTHRQSAVFSDEN